MKMYVIDLKIQIDAIAYIVALMLNTICDPIAIDHM